MSWHKRYHDTRQFPMSDDVAITALKRRPTTVTMTSQVRTTGRAITEGPPGWPAGRRRGPDQARACVRGVRSPKAVGGGGPPPGPVSSPHSYWRIQYHFTLTKLTSTAYGDILSMSCLWTEGMVLIFREIMW